MGNAKRHEPITKYPAADDREQIGDLLRHAFPLGLGSFMGLPEALKEADSLERARNDQSSELAD